MRRNSLGFEFPTSTSSGDSMPTSFLDDEEADADSAFVDDDLESSWDQLRMRQFKEQLSVAEDDPKAQARGSGHLLVRLMKKLMAVKLLLFTNGRLDKYEKVILVLALFLFADTIALSYLLATYPVYRDVLNRLGYQILHNSTSFFFKQSPLRDL